MDDDDVSYFIDNLLDGGEIEGEVSMLDQSFENDQDGNWECPVHLGPWMGWIKKFAWEIEGKLYKFRVCVPCSKKIISKRTVSIVNYDKEMAKTKTKVPEKRSVRKKGDAKKVKRYSDQYAVPQHSDKMPTTRIRRTTLEPISRPKSENDRVLHAYGLSRIEASLIASLAQLNSASLPDYMERYYAKDNDTSFNKWLSANKFITKGQAKQIVKTFFVLREKGIIDFDDKGVLVIE